MLIRRDHALLKKLANMADEIDKKVNQYLANFDTGVTRALSKSRGGSLQVPFDSKGAFAAGLAGVVSSGTLAVWATSLGPMGGLIDTATVVGILSTLGFSTAAMGVRRSCLLRCRFLP
jgi:hypothetical protein